ncbi:hypothetical protein HMPREF9999_01558, partial [Alloprevotella sp. oral taxon 473 str. F0040]
SIHAAQAGCDKVLEIRFLLGSVFQFTQPKRAATLGCEKSLYDRQFQFTQPKRAATFHLPRLRLYLAVSIHAAQAGCDYVSIEIIYYKVLFQFTQPKRAATGFER